MPTAVLACPRCSRSLRTNRAFTAGSRFRCPKCGASFAARPEDVPAPSAPPGVRPLPPPLDEGPPQRSGAWPLLFGLIGLGVLLLVGAGAVLALHFLLGQGPGQAVVTIPTPPADETTRPTAPDNHPDGKDNTDLPKPTPGRPAPPPAPAPPDLAPDAPPAALSVLPPEEQEKVNKAIERGVKWLKKEQDGEGTWGRSHPTGLAALPALTLLECGVSADDPHVRRAVAFVRRSVPNLTATYELALALLLLDRVGDPADEPLIRTMALRLLAGESPAGGWTYQCPLLSDKDERSLFTILETTRPRSSLDLVTTRGDGDEPTDLFTGRADAAPGARLGGGVLPLPPPADEKERSEAKAMYDGLSGPLKSMPALRPPTREGKMPARDQSDNSNTQFATLGLWAAGRHGVPMERALDLLARRFQVSQTPAGGWAYQYERNPRGGETPTMTGAGLLGLAVGHGLTADLRGADRQTADEDPRVEKGMKLVGTFIGRAHGRGKARTRPLERNYYFLWSVERVGMLYGRKTMGDKEWYPWGAEDLIELQGENGDWRGGTYPMAQPVPDTCFALLFLKRANLAKDLTNKLQFLTQIKER